MSFAITEWNLNPNRNWYVKLADAGSDISVKLYPTQADAAADTNLAAEGTADFGTGSKVILLFFAAQGPAISLFNDALSHHLKVSGVDADTTKTFHIAPFIDLPDINHNVYRSEALTQKKATSEINMHTHTQKNRSIGIAKHSTALSTGNVLNVQSTKRSLNVLATITEVLIIAAPDSLIERIETVQYLDMTHV